MLHTEVQINAVQLYYSKLSSIKLISQATSLMESGDVRSNLGVDLRSSVLAASLLKPKYHLHCLLYSLRRATFCLLTKIHGSSESASALVS